MRWRFTLKHQLTAEILQFDNNEFEVSLANWDQLGSGQAFVWNNPSSARSDGSSSGLSGTAAIGQDRPDDSTKNWQPGTYTIHITATNTSGTTGATPPFQSLLNIFGSDTGASLDDSVSFTGDSGIWAVGAGEITQEITFTLTQEYRKIFFSFSKVGPTTNYEVLFTINSIELIRVQEATDDQEISEPDGWKGAKIIQERDPQFWSPIERYDGAAGGAFNFYGDNGQENGGVAFIKSIEENYGFDSNIEFVAEFAPDDVNYIEIFSGLLDLPSKNEMKDNKMQVPVIRDDFWAKFINRLDTPVNLSNDTDLDGNPVDPVIPIDVNLPSQKIKKIHYSYEKGQGPTVTDVTDNEYVQFTPGHFETDEMKNFYSLIPIDNASLPEATFDAVEEGRYDIEVHWTLSRVFGSTENDCSAASFQLYFQINDQATTTLTKSNLTSSGIDYTIFTLTTSVYLLAGDIVRIYGRQVGALSTLQYGFWGTEGLVNGPYGAPTYSQPRPTGMPEVPTYTRVTAYTVAPATQAQGYLIHDLIHGILARLGLGTEPLYSEFLGSTLTNSKQYDEDGCGWMYVIIKGLQIRGYTLTEKPFFASFKQIWDGINPILNLGLGYEISENSPDYQYIRIEEKDHFLDDTISVNFSNVREIESTYDQDMIFKTIKTGYKKWQSENISGIDDPQTKQTRATRFEKVGKDFTIESDFIAASLAIENTRRTKKEQSADYKYDNDNFIIALNQDDVSPDVYTPELDENFNSLTNLNNSDTRYNTILTPLRSFFRWAGFFGGCLQSYLTSSYRFVSGEGNYDLVSDYNCSSGNECQAILCDAISESQDIDLETYNGVFGYYFLPLIYTITIPMEWEEYEVIRNNRKKAIGISQTTSGHIPFKIKLLEYDIVKGQATIKAWPKTFLSITVPEQDITMRDCVADEGVAIDPFEVTVHAVLSIGVFGSVEWSYEFEALSGTTITMTTGDTTVDTITANEDTVPCTVFKISNGGIAEGNGTVIFKKNGVTVNTDSFSVSDDVSSGNPFTYTYTGVEAGDLLRIEVTEG